MNPSNSVEKSNMSRNKPIKALWACRRSLAVSKICWKRSRKAYSVRSRGSFPNNASSFCLSSRDNSCGSRRNSHSSARNSLLGLRQLGLVRPRDFFPLVIDRRVEQLRHVEAIDYGLGVGQPFPAGIVERRGHVGPVGLYLLPLPFAQFFQAFLGRGLIAPVRHRQHFGLFGVGQVRED